MRQFKLSRKWQEIKVVSFKGVILLIQRSFRSFMYTLSVHLDNLNAEKAILGQKQNVK